MKELGDQVDKRFIEESFPVKDVSERSSKEKSSSKGSISTLHIWWTRKPLSSSRSSILAALMPASIDEIDLISKRNLIIDIAKPTQLLDENTLQKAQNYIGNYNQRNSPRVLDPFAGGGSIPLESLRLGCETFANDYNPVAVLIEKCTLEYPQKYGNSGKKFVDQDNHLKKDVEKFGDWVLNESKKELNQFYPNENESTPIGYYWMNTIKCTNPTCQADIPLTANFWLSKKQNLALFPTFIDNKIKFKIVGDNYEPFPINFDPNEGTISNAIATCIKCSTRTDAKNVRKQFREGQSYPKMVALISSYNKNKKFRIADKKDLDLFLEAEKYLNEKIRVLKQNWLINPVPDEIIHTPDNKEYGVEGKLNYKFNSILLYGITKWGDLFNSRQKLALITFLEKIRDVKEIMIKEGYDADYIKAVSSFLALSLNRLATYLIILTRWRPDVQSFERGFDRHSLSIVWDYGEVIPFNNSRGQWDLKPILNVIDSVSQIKNSANVINSSATNLPYENNYFDAIITDPPYYDNVPYADLSDFFYVILKRSIGSLYPELFSTPLTPKNQELISEIPLIRGIKKKTAHEIIPNIKTQEYFENKLSNSFDEFYRILKPNGIAIIIYAHKTTEGWETVINAILKSGLTVTASWPIATEMKSRLRAQKSAALASSIYIVARKIEKKEIGWFKDVKNEIENYTTLKLDDLWDEGITGPDFFIAGIGSAIEIFGKYKKILDNEGNEIKADKLLNLVRDVVSDYTVRQILHNGIADELSHLTKFYLMWRWNYGDDRVLFDDARKLAQSAGIDLTKEWNKGFIMKNKEYIKVIGPDDRENLSSEDSKELIDVLHQVCLLWKEGKNDELKFKLKKTGYGDKEAFFKVAQAISETLPNNSSEKRMIEGFLAGKERIMQDIRDDDSQTKLV